MHSNRKPLFEERLVLEALHAVCGADQVVELRVLGAKATNGGWPPTWNGYFNDQNRLVESLKTIGSATGIYITVNPVNPALLARKNNRLSKADKGASTGDQDIESRCWFLIDTDAQRPSGISASESEQSAAIARAAKIREFLSAQGWPEPIVTNKFVVQHGSDKSVTLYWYQSHNRVIASEYTAKLWLVADSIRYGRSDTSIVKVVVPVVNTLSNGAASAITQYLGVIDGKWLGVPVAPLASFAGSLVAVAIVYFLATARHHGLSTNTLLLAGVTMNAFFSALILFVQYFADFAETFRILRWLMGDLDVSSYGPLVATLPLVAVSFAAFAWLARPLNLLSLGTDTAETRGLDVVRAQRVEFVSASLATGAAVSVGGPVGFIGIIVPHLVRLMVGADHRIVLPASALFGAAFLVGCDVLSRTLMSPIELPVGIITALIGGPFFLWLLIRRP
jgi:iron complex transport system permease protein